MNRDVVGFFLDLPMGILYVVAGWMTNDQSQGVGSTAEGLSCLALPAALSRRKRWGGKGPLHPQSARP